MDHSNIPEKEIFDMLVSFVEKNHPKTSCMNFKRYFEMMEAKKALDELLRQNEEPECEVNIFPTFCSGSLRAEFESLEICNLRLFFDVMKNSDNFEIYTLENGRIRMAFVFCSLMVEIE